MIVIPANGQIIPNIPRWTLLLSLVRLSTTMPMIHCDFVYRNINSLEATAKCLFTLLSSAILYEDLFIEIDTHISVFATYSPRFSLSNARWLKIYQLTCIQIHFVMICLKGMCFILLFSSA